MFVGFLFYHLLLQRSVLDRNYESIRENYCFFFLPLWINRIEINSNLKGQRSHHSKRYVWTELKGRKSTVALSQQSSNATWVHMTWEHQPQRGRNQQGLPQRRQQVFSLLRANFGYRHTGIAGIIHKNRLMDDQWSVFYGSQAFLEKWNW